MDGGCSSREMTGALGGQLCRGAGGVRCRRHCSDLGIALVVRRGECVETTLRKME